LGAQLVDAFPTYAGNPLVTSAWTSATSAATRMTTASQPMTFVTVPLAETIFFRL
jgi:hypothetical protein